MAKKSRTIDKVIDLFEDHELHNMAMIVKDYEEDKKEFEAVYYKIKQPKDLLLVAEDALPHYSDLESMLEKINKLNKIESKILVSEFKKNNSKYFTDPRDEIEDEE